MNFIKSCILSTEKKEEEEIPQLPVESPDVKESGFKHLFEIQRISKKQLYDRNPEFVAKYAEEKLKQFTLVVCGAPKTGKSTLINAICGKAVADTSDSLDALTTDTKCYPVEGAYPVIEEEQDYQKKFRINIYDTKGITSWDLSIIDILKSTNPICMIYCATPGTFADLRMVEELIKECVRLKIFVALVCTNMWTNDDEHRETIMQEFDNVLKVHSKDCKRENGVSYYGDIALTMMINSLPFKDPDLGVYKPKEGINRLVYGIMKSLGEDKLLGWCFTVMENEGFWSQMQTQIQGFFADQFSYGTSILWSWVGPKMRWLKEHGLN